MPQSQLKFCSIRYVENRLVELIKIMPGSDSSIDGFLACISGKLPFMLVIHRVDEIPALSIDIECKIPVPVI